MPPRGGIIQQKALIIGLGGTGLDTIRELRRFIAERYERGLAEPEAASVLFLYIDTDGRELRRHSWSVLGKTIELRLEEHLDVGGDPSMIRETLRRQGKMGEWLPETWKSLQDVPRNCGTGGIRAYGRALYEFSKDRFKAVCVKSFDSLNGRFPQLSDWRIHLVAGTSGGTGSGMVLPLAYDLLECAGSRLNKSNVKVFGFFALPPLPEIMNPYDRRGPNAYAFLKELNYHALDGAHFPFTSCYLVEPRNAAGSAIGKENLPLLIAQRIFLGLQSSRSEALSDAAILDYGKRDPRRAKSFSTFGISSVFYPQGAIAYCVSVEQAARVVQIWLNNRDYPGDHVPAEVTSDLRAMQLSMAHIWGDKAAFGDHDFGPHKSDIEHMVDASLAGIPKRQLGEKVMSIRKEIENSYRAVGIHLFYRNRMDNLRGAAQKTARYLRLRTTELLRGPQGGLPHVCEYLNCLADVLVAENDRASTLSSKATTAHLDTLHADLSGTLRRVMANEQRFIYTNGRFEKDRAEAGDKLKAYLTLLTDREAARYAVALLDLTLKEVESLRHDLKRWESKLMDIVAVLRARRKSVSDVIAHGGGENGMFIFDPASIDQMLAAVPAKLIQPALEDNIRTRLQQTGLDLLGLDKRSVEEYAQILYEEAAKCLMNEAAR